MALEARATSRTPELHAASERLGGRCARYTSGMRISMWLLVLSVSSVGVLAESAGGVRWTAPAGWRNEGAQAMRAATYRIAPAPGDVIGAECGVYFFGVGQGGSVDANIERWKGQFLGPDGKPAPAKVATRKAGALTLTTIETAGAYSGMGGPTAQSRGGVPGYRLLGAIIEGPGGNVFVKFTGPAKTTAGNQQKFEQLLASFQLDK
jgi:hypothetical protein